MKNLCTSNVNNQVHYPDINWKFRLLPILCFVPQAETKGEEAAASAAEAGGGGRRGPELQETSTQRGEAQLSEAGGGLQLRRPHAAQGKQLCPPCLYGDMNWSTDFPDRCSCCVFRMCGSFTDRSSGVMLRTDEPCIQCRLVADWHETLETVLFDV